ncbi:hypothetical protein [Bacillus altitudinis]|uniref:hypothetical protein n=1 Tax=Bacillus altitudinis TaxID=293387 RepID=UPI003B52B57F
MGYEGRWMVGVGGEFSVGGGMIEIYVLTEEQGMGIEVFDREVDCIGWLHSERER